MNKTWSLFQAIALRFWICCKQTGSPDRFTQDTTGTWCDFYPYGVDDNELVLCLFFHTAISGSDKNVAQIRCFCPTKNSSVEVGVVDV